MTVDFTLETMEIRSVWKNILKQQPRILYPVKISLKSEDKIDIDR